MTGYDLFALAILAFSALAGWVRGGAREIITLFSFVLAAFIALIALPVTAPIARHIVHPEWLGWLAAAVLTFLVVYGLINLLAALLSRRLRETDHLSGIDRGVGLGFGLVRALVLLGAIHLVFHAATPAERVPGWFRNATVFPVSAASARVIQWALPGVGRGVDRLTPMVSGSVREGVNPAADRSPSSLVPPSSPSRQSQP